MICRCSAFRLLALPLVAVFLLAAPGAGAMDKPPWHHKLAEGDIIFQDSRSGQAEALRAAMGSNLTHMGLIIRDSTGWAVLEAVGPVRMTSLDQWGARGKGGLVAVKRVAGLEADAIQTSIAAARQQIGKPYDSLFRWDDTAIYCSELVYDAYLAGANITLGRPAPLGSFNLASPAARALFIKRLGLAPDSPEATALLQEPVISPIAIHQSPQLITIHDDFSD